MGKTDSLHCTIETNTALEKNYTPMQFILKKEVFFKLSSLQ